MALSSASRGQSTVIRVATLTPRFPAVCAACEGSLETTRVLKYRRGNLLQNIAVLTGTLAIAACLAFLVNRTGTYLASIFFSLFEGAVFKAGILWILAFALFDFLRWVPYATATRLGADPDDLPATARFARGVGTVLGGLILFIIGAYVLTMPYQPGAQVPRFWQQAVLPLIFGVQATITGAFIWYRRPLLRFRVPHCRGCGRTTRRDPAVSVDGMQRRPPLTTFAFRNQSYAMKFAAANEGQPV